MKRYALDLEYNEWREYIEKSLGEPKFRADQICEWIWTKCTDSVDDMTNLSKQLRETLAEKFDFAYPQLIREERSKDGTRKFLWKLTDKATVESVLMRYGDRLTACISTQVGCPLHCVFCATGLSGFVRNLSAGEIAGQFIAIEKHIGREINNVVYMGMGEPFLNTDAVLKSVKLLNDEHTRGLGIRHITISTSGVIPGIQALQQSGLGVRLAVSLHSADDETRSSLMPVNHNYPIAELRKALQSYQEETGDRITVEYALFGGVNDSIESARLLVRWLKGIHVFVNLIPANSVEARFEKPRPENIVKFRKVLETAGFETEIRAEQGADINAACGQLRRKNETGSAMPLDSNDFPQFEHKHTESEQDLREHALRSKFVRNGNAQHDRLKHYEKRNKEHGRGRSGGFEGSRNTEGESRKPFRPSGGFVEERGAHKSRKKELPPKERYRSGKMMEERPSFRFQNRDDKNISPEEPKRRDYSYDAKQKYSAEKRRDNERKDFGNPRPFNDGYTSKKNYPDKGGWKSKRGDFRSDKSDFEKKDFSQRRRDDKFSEPRTFEKNSFNGKKRFSERKEDTNRKIGAFEMFYSKKPKNAQNKKKKSFNPEHKK